MQEARVLLDFGQASYALPFKSTATFTFLPPTWAPFSMSSRGHEKFLLFTTRVLSFQFNLFFNRFFSVYYSKESLQDTKQLELTAQDHSLYRGISCESRQTSKVGTIAWFRMMTILSETGN